MVSIRDGLGGEELAPSGLQTGATNISPYFTGSITTASNISGANIYSTADIQGVTFSGTDYVNAQGELQSVAIGSPSSYGGIVQAGSGTLSGGSEVAIAFGASYTSTPHVVCTYRDITPDTGIVTGSNSSTTGFVALGDTASKDFDWVAVGV